ncbi:MAG: FAD-binding oxidoreductase, partial [Candidatus Acidiferrum sp.]
MDAATSSKTDSIANTMQEKLRSIVGAEHLRPANTADGVGSLRPGAVAEPGNEKELAAVLQCANELGVSVLPRGGGTKMNWGNPPSRADVILSTARLNSIIEHVWADLTVTVEAGCTIAKLQESLAQHGQRLALDALWPAQSTIGGVLSANESGALRLRFGGLRDLIIGVTVALPSGALASSGGKVVKNVAGYDLPKLVTGAYGTLGVITRAVFRLHPLPRETRSLSMHAANVDEAQRLMLLLQDCRLAHTALQARFGAAATPNLDIQFEGTGAGLTAQESHLRSLVQPTGVDEAPFTVWDSRQKLWDASEMSAIAKLSILQSDVAKT